MSGILEISVRLLVALLLGGVIGIEREFRAKDAGFRTHFLVCVGSALFCVVSQYGFGDAAKDASRVAAQVGSGIGFLGAGTIIFQKNVIRGLNTAAGLWVTAAIGLACGTGMLLVAGISTLLVLFGLEVLNEYVPQIGTTSIALTFTSPRKESVKRVVEKLKEDCIELYSYELRDRHTSTGIVYEVRIDMKVRRGNHNERLIDYMDEFDDVTISSIE